MIKRRNIIMLGLMLLGMASCENEDVYPSIITEFAEMKANDQGVATKLTLDNGTEYSITNQIAKLSANSTYRVMCGFTLEGKKATIYTLDAVYYLREDSVIVSQQDPTEVLGAWRAGHYINLHLAPKTQGGDQRWGFGQDSLSDHHAYVSLRHAQMSDPTSYSTDVYASIPVDSIKGITEGDTITLSINTFKGRKTWTMKR